MFEGTNEMIVCALAPTKASVATLVVLSPAVCVVAVVPFGSTSVLGRPSVQVPVVVIVQVPVAAIWFAVPAIVALVSVPVPAGKSAVTSARYVGAPDPPVVGPA